MENDEKYYGGMCEKCCDAGRGKYPKYQELHRDVYTLSPNVFKVHINGMIYSINRSSNARSHHEGRYGVGVDVCG